VLYVFHTPVILATISMSQSPLSTSLANEMIMRLAKCKHITEKHPVSVVGPLRTSLRASASLGALNSRSSLNIPPRFLHTVTTTASHNATAGPNCCSLTLLGCDGRTLVGECEAVGRGGSLRFLGMPRGPSPSPTPSLSPAVQEGFFLASIQEGCIVTVDGGGGEGSVSWAVLKRRRRGTCSRYLASISICTCTRDDVSSMCSQCMPTFDARDRLPDGATHQPEAASYRHAARKYRGLLQEQYHRWYCCRLSNGS
jgi:hypothetical protein